MSDKELERRLGRAVEHAAPDDLEGVLSQCREQKGKVIPMTKTMTGRRVLGGLLAACLALALVGGIGSAWYQRAYAVASVVSLDVNPSIELRINREEKVLSCIPLNEDARTVLAEMGEGQDLKGAKLDVAVNAVVGALVRHGYFNGLSSAILVSVEDKNQTRAAQLEAELKETIGSVLEAQAPNTTILSQTVTQEYISSGVNGTGDALQISSGKAALVDQVIGLQNLTGSEQDVLYQKLFEQLSSLTVEELSDLLKAGETRIPIGKSAAASSVEDYAGTMAFSSVTTDVDPELDELPAHYEVELHTPWGKFEYKVDAFTGVILSGPANVPALAEQPAETPEKKPEPEPTAPAEPAAPAITSPTLIGEEGAWEVAYKHAGCTADETLFTSCKVEYERGIPYCYELEFCFGDIQCEYEIDCSAGTILKYDQERCDNRLHGHGTSGNGHHSEDHGERYGGCHEKSEADVVADVGEAAALEAALTHAGAAESEVSKLKTKRDFEDGRLEYEVEFVKDGWEYEYSIDAATGQVLKFEKEKD